MPSVRLLLINLPPEETQHIHELLGQFDMEVGAIAVSTIQDAEPHFLQGNILLVIYRADEHRPRPDQDVRRIKRSLGKSVPLLVLLPPEDTRKVKDYIRAGADEYWILPLDSGAFPPRLYVLLEWGQSALTGETMRLEKKVLVRSTVSSLLYRAWNGLRRVFSVSPSEPSASAGLSTEIAGKWEKVRRLGFGSFGEVWLVREKGKENLAVAKIPHSQKMNTKFLREAAILKRLKGHPNAVEFKEVVKEEGRVILIQEYVEGSTLQESLDKEMSGTAKEKAFYELLEVVAYAHQQNIMHRDIKPENIIINESGVLKLLDFGTGKDLTRRSISNTVIGSRPYMAPEQIMGNSRLASDVWALGVVLYALSTEFLPFYDDNEKQLMDMILEVEPERPRNLEPELSQELEEIILKCLQKDWNKRYRNAVELRMQLLEHFPEFGKGVALPREDQ